MNFLESNHNACFVEWAYRALEHIPVEKESDFKVIRAALKCLVKNTEFPEVLPENIAGKIYFLKDIIKNPSLYIETSEHYDDFTSCLKMRIEYKRQEIRNLTVEQKELWIKKCKCIQEKIAMNNKIMTKETIQSQLMLLNDYSSEIMRNFSNYLFQFKTNINIASGISINCRFNYHLNFHLADVKDEDKLKEIKNKKYEMPYLAQTNGMTQDIQKVIEEDVYKHLDDLLKIGIVVAVIFYN